jgi:DNA-binding ferritin-like protein
MPKAATAVVRSYSSSVGVSDHDCRAIITLLSARLAGSPDLRRRVKWAHWNIKRL